MKKVFIAFWVLALGVMLNVQPNFGQCLDNDPSSPVGITPTIVAGNPSLCEGGKQIDPPISGTYNLDSFGNTVTVTITSSACGEVFSWSVSENVVIDQVVAKGGNQGANVYNYTSVNPSPTSDGSLHAPRNFNEQTGEYTTTYADLSHIDFCFHYKLTLSKTATTEFTRTIDWSIDKSCEGDNPLTLSTGQTFNYPFSWSVSAEATDSDWKVTGTITIANNTPFSATITSVSDVLSGNIAATLDCGTSFPYDLASGATLECTYTAEPGGAINGTNTVTVETNTDLVEGGTATADYTFGDPTSLVDECITVTDDCGGSVEVCFDDAPHTEEYTCPVGPYEVCGDYTHTNTATFTTNDQGLTGSDNCIIAVHVPCAEGCTLTPGYWKTHSKFGPAPHDNTWDQVGEDTPFFSSGKSYYQVLWTSPGGNAYYILAHAYIAAKLNFLNGADPSAAQAAFNSATTLFETYTPAQIAALKGSSSIRQQFISLASTLDRYNNGIIGPGHCSEDASKLSAADTKQSDAVVPEAYILAQNYPNPFNPSTTFSFDLPKTSTVKLTIYNLSGQEVAVVVNGTLNAGRHTFVWQAPANLISGVYFYKLQTAEFSTVKKMIFQK
ncbi:MAG: T9SS type A sorting domain-containing protein [bacterium]